MIYFLTIFLKIEGRKDIFFAEKKYFSILSMINDISQSSDILNFFFADDTTVFYASNPNDKNTSVILDTELEKVSLWLAANK